jgi:hypothetical protein
VCVADRSIHHSEALTLSPLPIVCLSFTRRFAARAAHCITISGRDAVARIRSAP